MAPRISLSARNCDGPPISASRGAGDLSGNNIVGIENLVHAIQCPVEDWRIEANKRIKEHRQAVGMVSVLDKQGRPLGAADIEIKLIQHAFKFAGVAQARLWHGGTGNVNMPSAARYRQLYLDFGFNKAGFQNALKYKQRHRLQEYVQPALDWFNANDIEVRGHTLIWPAWENMESEISAGDAARIRDYDRAFSALGPIAPAQLGDKDLSIYLAYIVETWGARWDVLSGMC